MIRLCLLVMIFSYVTVAQGQYDSDVKQCIKHWKTSPFSANKLNYRTLKASVSVFGVGGEIDDTQKTKAPELIYLKPSVNVLGKSTIRLMNPNGWYCLKSNTNVLGKAVIELHCKAKLAISNTGATVLGSDKGEQQGTTVLGKTKIKRVGCK